MRFRIHDHLPRPGAEPKLPGVLRLVHNALRASASTGRDLAAGRGLGSDDLRAARRPICLACDFFRASDERCSHPKCGCYLRLKTYLVGQKCPEGKW